MIVHHARGEYPIVFESLAEASSRLPDHSFVITDENVAATWWNVFAGRPMVVLPAGEHTKRLSVVGESLEWLASQGATRRATVVALGGGVIGDLAGFVAAAYMRGVDLWQIPTTLLAQVDSSVGGKVGVDLDAGKNLAGAFHPPIEVSICAEVLRTLAERQLRNGAAEVWKYGYIKDTALLARLRNGTAPEHPDIVRRCIEIKRDVVQEDEFETLGIRAILNFGHTIGHAIEKVCQYERFLHGEAIAIGMVLEARWGERIGITKQGVAGQIAEDLSRAGLPVEIPNDLSRQDIVGAAFADKKRGPGAELAASLVVEPGTCKLFTDLDPRTLEGTLLDT